MTFTRSRKLSSILSLAVFGLAACSLELPDERLESTGNLPVGSGGALAGSGGALTGSGSGGAGKGGATTNAGSGGAGSDGGAGEGSAGTDTGGSDSGRTAGEGGTVGVPPGTNLFSTLMDKTQEEVDDKVTTAVNRFFGIGTGEPNTPIPESGYRCYYELPDDPSMAYIWAADTNDVRTEGMSYGMMIAVQMGMQTEFDKLWKFAKTYMQYPADTATTAWKYYFRWKGTVSESSVSFGATTVPAPDGEEYFIAALYLADQRWGSSGTVNYRQEADNISAAMLHNAPGGDNRYPIVHASENMVVFVPYGNSYGFSDPSYHLPAFYELFALHGPSADAAKWQSMAATSRAFLVSSAHATTGLHPDYATFAGLPTTSTAGDGHDRFKYDAWRVVMNMAIDYVWFSQDPGMKAQIEKYHAFFTDHLGTDNVSNALFYVDGSNPSGGSSTALTATLAVGALVSDAANKQTYVDHLWNVSQQTGTYRYYQECVYLLGLLAVADKYKHEF